MYSHFKGLNSVLNRKSPRVEVHADLFELYVIFMMSRPMRMSIVGFGSLW